MYYRTNDPARNSEGYPEATTCQAIRQIERKVRRGGARKSQDNEAGNGSIMHDVASAGVKCFSFCARSETTGRPLIGADLFL